MEAVKIEALETTIDELQLELEMKSREIVELKDDKKTLINRYNQQKESKKESEMSSQPPVRDSLRSRNEEMKGLDVRVPSQSTELNNQKEKDSKMLSIPEPPIKVHT